MVKRADRSVKHRAYQKAERAGKLAELLICLRYFFYGYRLLHWRHRTAFGEIDLIMKRGAHLCFIEVKYRKNGLAQMRLCLTNKFNASKMRHWQAIIAYHLMGPIRVNLILSLSIRLGT